MNVTARVAPCAFASEDYWRGVFTRNPDFCSWQTPRQAQVRDRVSRRLSELPGRLRVLDFGIGNLGLYRTLDDALLRRMSLTGISESQQHAREDPLLARYRIRIEIGSGLSPCARVPNGSQDVVLCTYVFAYLDARTRAEALAAFARVLVPGGRLVLVLHHPSGERERKFRRAEPFWPEARSLYEHLIQGRYARARALAQTLTVYLDETFEGDEGFVRYLASYLKTAHRCLALLRADGAAPVYAVPDAALADCRDMRRLIDREWSMTCRSFHPVEDPAAELDFPAGLRPVDIAECVDPTRGSPIARVVTASLRV